jgi:hypothetical protein
MLCCRYLWAAFDVFRVNDHDYLSQLDEMFYSILIIKRRRHNE